MKNFALLFLVLGSPSYASVDTSDAEQTVLIDGLADVGYSSYISYTFSPPMFREFFMLGYKKGEDTSFRSTLRIRANRACSFLNGYENLQAKMVTTKNLDRVSNEDLRHWDNGLYGRPGYEHGWTTPSASSLIEIDEDGVAMTVDNGISYIKYLECRAPRP